MHLFILRAKLAPKHIYELFNNACSVTSFISNPILRVNQYVSNSNNITYPYQGSDLFPFTHTTIVILLPLYISCLPPCCPFLHPSFSLLATVLKASKDFDTHLNSMPNTGCFYEGSKTNTIQAQKYVFHLLCCFLLMQQLQFIIVPHYETACYCAHGVPARNQCAHYV